MQVATQPLPPVKSQLHPKIDGGRSLAKALLELWALQLCSTIGEAHRFVTFSLMFTETPEDHKKEIPQRFQADRNVLRNRAASDADACDEGADLC